MAKITPLYPQFASMGGTAVRLVRGGKNNYFYYRDGGDWDVDVHRFGNGDLITCSDIGSLNGIKLKTITEDEWRKSNAQYVPDEFERYGWEIEPTPKWGRWGSNPCAEIALPEAKENNNMYLLIRRR